MSTDLNHLTAAEKRSAIRGPLYRVIGTPVVALLGLANTAIIVRETGASVFGLVALVATITLLFPFADQGIGATAMTAGAQLSGPNADPRAADVIRRSYHVLFGVAGLLIAAALAIMAADKWTVLTGFSSGPADRWAITAAAFSGVSISPLANTGMAVASTMAAMVSYSACPSKAHARLRP